MEVAGYVLRISTKEWVERVFSLAIYYTNIHRRWAQGQIILFVHKTDVGDALVGYGIVETACEKDELSDEEKHECEEHGWEKAVVFRYVVEFGRPLPIKKTFLSGAKFRGRYCHGLRLNKEQLGSIINNPELLQR